MITAQQAREHGLDRSAVVRRVASGDWIRAAARVYRLADYPYTDRTRVRVATLTVGPQGVLSGLAAAYWHGIVGKPPKVITVTAPRGWHGRAAPAVRVMRRTLDDTDVVERKGLRVTGIALSVLDGAVDGGGVKVIDTALQLRRTTVDDLVDAYERRRGCVGAVRMGQLLLGVQSGARSAAERLTVNIFRKAGITGWTANLACGSYEIDFAFREHKVAVEIDGIAFHNDAVSFQRDRTKLNAMVTDGWLPLSFTWGDLVERPGYVTAQVSHALAPAA
ncbi:hypothetical protein D7316_04713 [Gordonia insulae]|uniref:DUF559 domain-containing protein n=1 Tax=Gordonia insulae TaxID=2420509 RepID=A0A3G8JVA8_9ACTN|nr:hypothetical protein D7316_04713 [Gordonia insulae]